MQQLMWYTHLTSYVIGWIAGLGISGYWFSQWREAIIGRKFEDLAKGMFTLSALTTVIVLAIWSGLIYLHYRKLS